MEENEANRDADPEKQPRQKKINKVPVVKKAKLLPKNESKHKHLTLGREDTSQDLDDKKWNETKIFILPLMPTDEDEKKCSSADYRCAYCNELCDEANLECKVCFKIAHISCLYRRGYLETEYVPQKTDWSCADCSDLTKCLSDDEMRKIINIFDQLDFRKNCFVKLDDYLRIKRKMCEDDGGLMTNENEIEEKKRFSLMDLDNTGSITWNEFVDFETANLLSKKNKVELSNHLSKKELIVAKKKFLSYDREKMKMINKEDAKTCYMDYIRKLKEKLGAPIEEHISNCVELFGFRQDPDAAKSTAKTMWPEFVRKITLLLLYDRINSQNFRPRYWKPGSWFLESNEGVAAAVGQATGSNKKEQIEAVTFRGNTSRMSSAKLSKNSFFNEEIEVKEQKVEKNNLLDINTIMASNLDINSFKPYDMSDFGSFNYVIRSRVPNNNNSKPSQALDEDDLFKFKSNRINLNPINRNNNNKNNNESSEFTNQLKSTSFNLQNLTKDKKLSTLDKNNPNQSSIENLFLNAQTASNLKLAKIAKGTSYLNLNGSNEQLNQLDDNQNTHRTSSHDFEYSKVTDDIYKAFGKSKQSKYNYPQQIHVVKTASKSNKQNGENKEEEFIHDLIENTNYSKSVLASKNDFFGQSTGNKTNRDQLVSKYSNLGGYRDGARLVPLESSRLDSRSINGGATSNLSSTTNFSTARNNKLLKILGEY